VSHPSTVIQQTGMLTFKRINLCYKTAWCKSSGHLPWLSAWLSTYSGVAKGHEHFDLACCELATSFKKWQKRKVEYSGC